MQYEVEVLAPDGNKCGEAPTWEPDAGCIVWTDNASDLVYRLDPRSRAKSIISRGLSVNGIALNRPGEFVFAGATGIHVWRGPGQVRTIATEHDGETLVFNDIIAAPGGRVYGGTQYWGAEGMIRTGKLYRFDPDGSVHVMDEGIQASNGLGFSPDDRTLYYADTTARKIYAYDVGASDGSLSRRRVFVDVPAEDGIPDGLTVDTQGCVWCAMWYGGQIVRYDPEGGVERRIRMPVAQVSSVLFGGADYTDLFVTSAGQLWKGPFAPPGFDFNAPNVGGSLYRIRMDVQGRPEHRAALPWRE